MEAVAVEQREDAGQKRANAAALLKHRVWPRGLVEAEVVQRTVVARLLLAVEIRGVGDQLGPTQVALDLERRKIERVRVGALRRIRVDEAVVARIGVERPVALDVV